MALRLWTLPAPPSTFQEFSVEDFPDVGSYLLPRLTFHLGAVCPAKLNHLQLSEGVMVFCAFDLHIFAVLCI